MAIKYGDLLKQLRLEKKLTQQDLANLTNYSKQHISRIENNEVSVPYEATVLFSKVLKFDFIKLSKHMYDFESYADYLAFNKLVKALETGDFSIIRATIKEYDIESTFNYGALKYIRHYANAVLLTDNEPVECIDYCLKIFNIEREDLDKYRFENTVVDYELGIFVTLGTALYANNEMKYCKMVVDKLYTYFNNVLFNTDYSYIDHSYFTKKMHTLVINNYAEFNFYLKNYELAKSVCIEAIDRANEYNLIYKLHFFYKLKMEICYMLNEIDEATECFEIVKVMCKINKKEDYFDNVLKLVEKNYPLILI